MAWEKFHNDSDLPNCQIAKLPNCCISIWSGMGGGGQRFSMYDHIIVKTKARAVIE
jgi:hypothetical protein